MSIFQIPAIAFVMPAMGSPNEPGMRRFPATSDPSVSPSFPDPITINPYVTTSWCDADDFTPQWRWRDHYNTPNIVMTGRCRNDDTGCHGAAEYQERTQY